MRPQLRCETVRSHNMYSHVTVSCELPHASGLACTMSQRVNVVVPDGLAAGDEFIVTAHGADFSVTVPEGAYGGHEIDLDLPLPEDSASASATQRVVVEVPDGVASGELFSVEFDGRIFEVTVPEGMLPGDEIEIELPTSNLPPPTTASQGGVGWDDWDTAWAPVPKGAASWAEPPAPVPYYGRYKIDEKVQVQRSSGAWSPATVKEYDELSDTYTIELLVSKMLKYMVSENEIQPLEFQAQQCGEHFVGRRVQVPFVGALSKDDVMGEVRAYDEATGTYTVALDSGVTKQGLISDEIKVRPDRKKKAT